MIGIHNQHPPLDLTDKFTRVQVTCNDVNMKNVKVELANRNLWSQFFPVGTEMILTRAGRRMFPDLQFTITGLEPTHYYFVLLDIVPADDFRYRFIGPNWMRIFKSDAPPHKANLYCHPDSPALGTRWMSMKVTFDKLKLTINSPQALSSSSDNVMVLNSMHRYIPRLHLYRGSDIARLDPKGFTTFCFPETTFMAVTSYQNDKITVLKIRFNPFAAKFRENESRRPSKRHANEAGGHDGAPDPKTSKKELSPSNHGIRCPSLPDSPGRESSSSECQSVPSPNAVPSALSPALDNLAVSSMTPFDPRYLAISNYNLQASWRDMMQRYSPYALSSWLAQGAAHVGSPFMPNMDPRMIYPLPQTGSPMHDPRY